MSPSKSLPGEFELIARYFAPLAEGVSGAAGLTDDAATIARTPGRELVVTCDTLVETVHFLADDPPNLVARKALRINLSDLAAMGAEPRGYLLSLALDPARGEAWVEAFAAGLAQDQATYGVHLVGGDTVATPGPLAVTVTAYGEVEVGRALHRSGARAGHDIYVSGTIGDAGLGLRVLGGALEVDDAADRAWLAARYQTPEPRIALGRALVGIAAAAVDVSDGLVADLGHVCEASRCGAEIALAAAPVSAVAKRCAGMAPLDLLTLGDDYELLFTAPPERAADVTALGARLDLRLTRIGAVTEGVGARVIDAEGDTVAVPVAGYQHF